MPYETFDLKFEGYGHAEKTPLLHNADRGLCFPDKCREQGLSPPISYCDGIPPAGDGHYLTEDHFLDLRILLTHNLPWAFVFSKCDKSGTTEAWPASFDGNNVTLYAKVDAHQISPVFSSAPKSWFHRANGMFSGDSTARRIIVGLRDQV